MRLLRAKEVFSHGIYTTYWDENAKMMAKQKQYTCLRDANQSEFEPMWNRREGKITEKQKGRRLLREGNGARGK